MPFRFCFLGEAARPSSTHANAVIFLCVLQPDVPKSLFCGSAGAYGWHNGNSEIPMFAWRALTSARATRSVCVETFR
jgi:hypothetical protein